MTLLKIFIFCFVLSYSMKGASAVTEPHAQKSNVTTKIETNEDAKETVKNKTQSEIKTPDKDSHLDLDEDYSQEDDYESESSSEEFEDSGRINKNSRKTNNFDDILKEKGSNKTMSKVYNNEIEESQVKEITSAKSNITNVDLEKKTNSIVNSDKKIVKEATKETEVIKQNPIKPNNTNTNILTKYDAVTHNKPEIEIKSNINETLLESSKNMSLLRETQKQSQFNDTKSRNPVFNINTNRFTNTTYENQNQEQSKHKTNLKDKENNQIKEVLYGLSTEHELNKIKHETSATQSENNDVKNATIQNNDAQNATIPNNDEKNATIQNNDAQNVTIQNNDAQDVTIQNNDAQNAKFQNNHGRNATIQNNNSQKAEFQNNDAQNVTIQNNDSQNVTIQNIDEQNVTIQNNVAQNATIQNNDAQNATIQNNVAQNAVFQKNDEQNATIQNNDAQNVMIQNNDAQNATIQNNDAENADFQKNDGQNATFQYLKPIFSKNEKPFQRPHILFIVADDLGWGDVSFHGSDQIMTPNLDILAYTGVVLSQYYTDVQGSASRSALFTGKYPLRLGTQGDSIRASEDRGIPVAERLLPSYLRDLGYATHLVGKWDVGKSREQYLPTSRGFDSFYGFLGGAVDYYTYNQIEEMNETSYFGCDLFNGTAPAVEPQQGYLTEVITDRALQIILEHNVDKPMYLHVSHLAPHAGGGLVSLQAPAADIQANQHIAHSARRLYAGMVTNWDNSVGNMIAALGERGMLDNTLIVIVSDNGAPTAGDADVRNYGSNSPLRGTKRTPWEGGARTTGIIWKQTLKSRTFDRLFHVTDWLPTLISAAGANGNVDEKLDGLDQWHTIATGAGDAPKRTDVLVSIDDSWAALREGYFKLIVGDLDERMCRYTGMEFQRLRQKPPPYENVLVESKTFTIFKESLNLTLNIDEALAKRRQFDLKNQMFTKNVTDFCIPSKNKGCLYNITSDPLESIDLWDTYPDIARRLSLRLRTIWTELKPRSRLTGRDPRANPALHNYVWTPWVKDEEIKMEPNITTPPFPLQVSLGEIQYLVDLNLNMFRESVLQSIKSIGDSFLKTVNGLF